MLTGVGVVPCDQSAAVTATYGRRITPPSTSAACSVITARRDRRGQHDFRFEEAISSYPSATRAGAVLVVLAGLDAQDRQQAPHLGQRFMAGVGDDA
ncbi:hypothetical protein AB0K18_30590 [Nonomuraea sp. NPDC049421]|uniref:hypothetical protein n=1 Tax=Nonomuraea sp. NPDC049421 TaxID=3155275 RepID=UPI003420AD03